MRTLSIIAIVFFLSTCLALCVFNSAHSRETAAKEPTAHMIGHHHIDLIWLWPWEESVQVTRATWESVLNRMDENPDIRFLQNSAAAYKWIEDVDPKMFREITKRVREGRWVIIGGWWVEPDCNVPSGEAFVRQGLYGKRYFKEKFDVETDIGYNPDSFGHNWMLPQILRKMRYTKYMFMRPNAQENQDVPADIFWWESPDGSRVLTYRLYRYGIWGEYEESILNSIKMGQKYLNEGINDILVFYGIGNHGGIMTKKLINVIRELQAKSKTAKIIFSDPVEFFKTVEQSGIEFPLHSYDLQYHAQGCYSTITSIKKMNRENENLLCTAEKFSVLANLLMNRPYPGKCIRRGWENVLFNQFHDILPGSSIRSAYQDVIAWHGEARMKARTAINKAVQSIACQINTEKQSGIPIIVWNPHGSEVTAPAEVELAVMEGEMLPHFGPLVDENGVVVPHQLEPAESYMGSNRRRRVIFYPEMPAFGYKTFWLQEGESSDVKSNPNLFVNENTETVTMENDHVSIMIDKKTGYVVKLENKDGNVVVIKEPAAVPVVIQDSSDTWSHDVLKFDNVIGKFGDAEVSIMESGTVRARVQVKSYFRNSKIIQDFILYGRGHIVEVRVSVDWHEQLKMLKMKFPVNIQDARSYYAIPFGFIEREPNGNENPGGAYLAAHGSYSYGKQAGLILLNDGKYGFDVDANIMAMTIQRSPVFAHHLPYVLKEGIEYPYMDKGEHEFKYAMIPFAGEWTPSESEKAADLLNVPLIALQDYRHSGTFRPEQSFLTVNANNVIVTAVKQHEDSEDIIIRIHEADGKTTSASVSLNPVNKEWRGMLKPYEIKTLRFPKTYGECFEVDMIEWDRWE